MHLVLQQQQDSSFPIFYGTYKDDFIFIIGGGGASRSGVPNLIQIYNKNDFKKALAEFQLGIEYGLYIHISKSDNTIIAVTNQSILLLQINYETFEITQLDKITIEKPIANAITSQEYIVVFYTNQLLYFTAKDNKLKQLFVDKLDYEEDYIRAILSCKQENDNGILLLTKENVIYHPQPFINVNDEVSEKEISDVKVDVQPSKKAIQLNNDVFLFQPNLRKNITIVSKYSKNFQLLQKKTLKFNVSLINHVNQQLVMCSDQGRLYVYSNKLKRLCSKKSSIDTMMTCIENAKNEILLTSVSKFITYQVNNNDRILLISLIIGAYIASLIFMTFL